jgi:hypothetical protein
MYYRLRVEGNTNPHLKLMCLHEPPPHPHHRRASPVGGVLRWPEPFLRENPGWVALAGVGGPVGSCGALCGVFYHWVGMGTGYSAVCAVQRLRRCVHLGALVPGRWVAWVVAGAA